MDHRKVVPLHRAPPAAPVSTRRGGAPEPFVAIDDDLIEQLRQNSRAPTFRAELADDWRDFISEVRGSPFSHALVAIGTVILWTVLLVLPLVIGEWF